MVYLYYTILLSMVGLAGKETLVPWALKIKMKDVSLKSNLFPGILAIKMNNVSSCSHKDS